MKLAIKLFILFIIFGFKAFAQQPQLNFKALRINDTLVKFTATADLANNIRLYGVNPVIIDGVQSELNFEDKVKTKALGAIIETVVTKGFDSVLTLQSGWFTGKASIEQNFKIPLGDSSKISGKFVGLYSNGKEALPFEQEFEEAITSGTAPEIKNTPAPQTEHGSLWNIFFKGFLAGLAAFIMPCIFAMLPITVSFFLKKSTTRAKGLQNMFMYAGSIIGIFALFGLLVGLLGNQKLIYQLSTSPVFNIAIFILFIVFGISFLGAFEIMLPSSWITKADSKASNKSFLGIFFMALTLVLVSFSCTVPFIAGVAAFAISSNNLMAGVIGFGAFGLAIALPFALGALFPNQLNKVAKSGGWLNAVKVSLGIIEIGLAFKFFSNVDLAYHWRILDREVYLAIWIALTLILGVYLLGLIKFKHDSELPKNDYGLHYLSIPRFFFAVSAFAFMFYLIPGLWGAPLKGISGFLPEMKTQDFNLTNQSTATASTSNNGIQPVKYTSFLKSEIAGVTAFFDYNEALTAAKQLKKPVMLDFTGHSCVNCRKMEQSVLRDPAVVKILQTDFIVASLYVDDKYKLPEPIKSKDGSTLKTLGDYNLDLEIQITNNNAQPYYVFVDGDGKLLSTNFIGYDPSVTGFIKALEEVKAKYRNP